MGQRAGLGFKDIAGPRTPDRPARILVASALWISSISRQWKSKPFIFKY